MEQGTNFWQTTALQMGGVQVSTLELVVLIVAVGGVFWYMRRRHAGLAAQAADAAGLRETLARLAEGQTMLDTRVQTLASGSQTAGDSLRRTLDERLDAVTKRLGEGLADTQRRTGESLSKLNERLAVIDSAQANIKALTGEVTGLQALLANKQQRGAFGEIQMQDLVRTFLPPNAFGFQETLGNGARVDCLIKLPNPPGPVAVDAKFPLEAWRAYAQADDAALRETAARALRTDVTRHLKAIAEKYLIAGETADTALMFVPSEAVYATIHADFPDLIDKSFKARVMIVSPTTFMATLNTMRAVMKDARMREQTHVIQREVGLLGEDVARLDVRVEKLQTHFDQASRDVKDIRTSTDKITRRAQRIDEAQLADGPDALVETVGGGETTGGSETGGGAPRLANASDSEARSGRASSIPARHADPVRAK